MSILTLAPVLSIQTLILHMARLMELLKLHCRQCFLYLSSFVLASLCCVGFSSGAKADSATQWTATWNLSNHQTVDFSIAPGASVFRGWTLNINGPMVKGQVYYIKNSPALLGNSQNEGPSFSVHEVALRKESVDRNTSCTSIGRPKRLCTILYSCPGRI